MSAQEKTRRLNLTAQILREADERARAVAEAVTPHPMVVTEADVLTGKPIPGAQTWTIPEGPCGFAWVRVSAKDTVSRRFINDLKNLKPADEYGHEEWRHDSYYGGFSKFIGLYNQSVTRKEAYAHEYARVLRAYGIDAHGASRLD
jgi:hypothetical protein